MEKSGRINLTISLLFFAGAIAIAVGALLQDYYSGIHDVNRVSGTILALWGLVIGVGVFVYGHKQENFSLFEIIYPLTALYMLNYPLRELFALWFPSSTRYVYGLPSNAETYLTYALLLFDIGFLAFVVGYFLPGGKRIASHLPKISWDQGSGHLYQKSLIIYGVGFVAFLALWSMGSALRFQWIEEDRVTASYNILIFLSHLRVIGLYLIWLAFLNRRKPSRGLVPYLALLFEILVGVAIGSKQDIFQAIVAVLFAYHYANRRVTMRAVALGGIFLLFLFPLVQTYRDVYNSELGLRPNPQVTEVLSLSDDVSAALTSNTRPISAVEQVMNRANQLDYLAVVVYRVPRYVNYTNTLWPNIVAAFVPRSLWPSKPVLVLGRYMVTVIMGSPSSSNAPVTNMGEFYLNFGALGVPLGMLVLGIFYRFVYTYLHRLTDSRTLQGMLYLAVFPSMLFLSTGIASFPAGIVRTMLLMFVITWLFFRKSPSYVSSHRISVQQ